MSWCIKSLCTETRPRRKAGLLSAFRPDLGQFFLALCDIRHKDTSVVEHRIRSAGAASEDTPGVGTGHACEALDGCLQPEGFDSSVLRMDRPTKLELSD